MWSRILSSLKEHQYLAAWIGVPIAIVAIWLPIHLAQNHSSGEGTGSGGSSTSTFPSTSQPPVPVTPPASSPCSTTELVPATCTAPDAWLSAQDAECQSASVQSSLGNDPALRPLLLETTSTSGTCLARPDKPARDSGATAADLLNRLTGPAPKLTQCGLNSGQTLVTCSQAHTMEFVGPWQQPASGKLAVSDCEDPARRYSGRNLSVDPDLAVVVLSATDGRYRCGLALRQAGRELVDSVWMLGNNAMPVG
jgi:hypothetical protein